MQLGVDEEMAMTLQGQQGTLLSNGSSTAVNRVPLSGLESNKDATNLYLNDANNINSCAGVCDNEQLKTDNPSQSVDQVAEVQEQSDEPCIDITINNVVCSFSVKSHLNLKQIAQNGFNVEYRRENGVTEIGL